MFLLQYATYPPLQEGGVVDAYDAGPRPARVFRNIAAMPPQSRSAVSASEEAGMKVVLQGNGANALKWVCVGGGGRERRYIWLPSTVYACMVYLAHV